MPVCERWPGFLRSRPSKDELLLQVRAIRRRQRERPAWIPRTDPDGNPLSPSALDSTAGAREPDRQTVIATLSELGGITVPLPTDNDDRPELAMEPGGTGEWEAALFSVLGFTGPDASARTIEISAAANQALVPDEARWWSPEPLTPVPATQDPGVASELLATSATLGGLPVTDNTLEAHETIVDALVAAGDWRYTPEWLLARRRYRFPCDLPRRHRRVGRRDPQRDRHVRLRRGAARRRGPGRYTGPAAQLHAGCDPLHRRHRRCRRRPPADLVVLRPRLLDQAPRERLIEHRAAAPPALPRVAVSALGSVAGKVVVLSIWCLLYLRICTECDRGVTPFLFLQARRHRCWSGWAPRPELA